MSEKPLVPWTIAERNGRILAAHCNLHPCSITRLGYSCRGREKGLTTSYPKKCLLGHASRNKTVPYAPLSEISFVGKKRKTICITGDTAVDPPTLSKNAPQVCAPSDTEKAKVFNALAKCEGAKPAMPANVPPYCEAYIPASLDQDLPMIMSDLHKKEYLSLEYRNLLQLASETEVQVTVEAKTRDQTKWIHLQV